jgi:hypothetical protein
MASGGSKRRRALYGESTTYEMRPRPEWKHYMAESRKWKQNVAESRNITAENLNDVKYYLGFAERLSKIARASSKP